MQTTQAAAAGDRGASARNRSAPARGRRASARGRSAPGLRLGRFTSRPEWHRALGEFAQSVDELVLERHGGIFQPVERLRERLALGAVCHS